MRRQACRILAAIALLSATGCDSRPGTSVLLVSLDTLRADAVSGMPFLSRLAAEGTSFPRVYAGSNWTLPSHASLLLSQPCSEHRVTFKGQASEPHATLPESATVLAEAFQAVEFRTFSSSEGGYLDPAFGFARGFDGYHLVPALSHDPATEIDRHADELVRFVAAAGPVPVFAFVHTYRVHDYFLNGERFQSELLPGDSAWADRGSLRSLFNQRDGTAPPGEYLHRLYRGAALDADRFLSRLVERARGADPKRRWLVVVTSDHGETFGDDPGLRGHGTELNEDQLRIPWIVAATDAATNERLPRSASPLVSSVDIAPSLLRFLNLPVPATFRGRADLLLPGVSGDSPPLEASFVDTRDPGAPIPRIALFEGARALRSGWRAPSPTFDCFERASEQPGIAAWSVAPGRCADLESVARARLRRWIAASFEARSTDRGPVVSDALRAELESLGYL